MEIGKDLRMNPVHRDWISFDLQAPESRFMGDLDNDGDLDLISTNLNESTILIYPKSSR